MVLAHQSIFSGPRPEQFSLPTRLSAVALLRQTAPPADRRSVIQDRPDAGRQLFAAGGLIPSVSAQDPVQNRRLLPKENEPRTVRGRRSNADKPAQPAEPGF